ncbi:MAG: hypothetical protein EPN14_10790 [Gallionella sp.]|nr:MAG: hypothetical protein EPN14_10790 [Gallionella sp.]
MSLVQLRMSLGVRKLGSCIHDRALHTRGPQTLAQVRAFVSGNEAIPFTLTDRQAVYGWIADTLKQFHYRGCTRADRGALHGTLSGNHHAQAV